MNELMFDLDNKADIVICDGFTGNIVLKLIEGTVSKMLSWASDSINNHSISKLAKPMLFPVFQDIKKTFDYEEHGGAPLLGVNGIVLKCHGSCSEISIDNSLNIAYLFAKEKLIHKIENELSENKIVTDNE